MKSIRIFIHDRTGVPFTVQLARKLAERGYTVCYSYGAFFQSPKGNVTRQVSDGTNFQIAPIDLNAPFRKYSFIKRYFQELEYANKLAAQIIDFSPQVVIHAGSHPDAISVIYKKCRFLEIKFVFWVQDIYGVAIERIIGNRVPILGKVIGRHYINKERRLLRESDDIIIITEDFSELMTAWGIEPNWVHVIHNWTPLEEIPVTPKQNRWAEQNELDDKFCFLYSGTLGMKHNPELLLNLATQFKKYEQARVVVVSEGLGAEWLRGKKQSASLDNLIILDFQPYERMPEVLGTADVLVAILEPEASIYSVPSKVLTYLCAQRPLLLAVPEENLSARTVSDNNAGLVAPPTDRSALLRAAEKLFSDNSLRLSCGANARRYAEEHFDIELIGDQFEEIIDLTAR